ncbi:hypothetical protein SLE2022_275330 [Rubroshorea leprosula]
MEKATSSRSDSNSISASANATNNQNCTSSSSPPLRDHDQYRCPQDFVTNFTSLHHSIFPPKSHLPPSSHSPSGSSSSSDDFQVLLDPISDAIATERRLNQARLLLEYHQLCQHYDLCLARLQVLCQELETLRRENADLRLTNSELVKLLSLSSQAVMKRSLRNEDIANFNVQSETRSIKNVESSLPKSISIRSSDYPKNQQQGPSRMRVAPPLVSGSVQQQRVCVPLGDQQGQGEEALEFEAYNRGMMKTELCNKWQETGSCPYGDHCQFAHGISELRTVIRHPRYKTEVCKMVLGGERCPYGHRCHFRHSLTEQERMRLSR